MMKPLFIAGTRRHIGKTTMSLGLLHAFRRRKLNVGYMKPLGQRMQSVSGRTLHEDAALVTESLGFKKDELVNMAVPLPRGRVAQEVQDLDDDELLKTVRETYTATAEGRDLVVVEGMGHVAMGSCLRTSAAEVANTLGAKVLLVSEGGVGSAIDNISLSWEFLRARGADVIGVVVNQVWPQKYTRIKQAVTRGLENLGIRSFGTVPFEEKLSQPTMRQVHDVLGGELVSGQEQLSNRVENTIVAAMEASHMISYLKKSTLVFTPGDRSDNLLAALSASTLGDVCETPITGLVLTGGFRPDGAIMRMIEASRLPAIMIDEDTYTAASKFHATAFKIAVGDREKVEWAFCLAEEHVDVDAIIEELR